MFGLGGEPGGGAPCEAGVRSHACSAQDRAVGLLRRRHAAFRPAPMRWLAVAGL